MTKSLPSHPSLKHLRNEAKELLKARKQENPDAPIGLQECQHALAQEYGFKNWTELKARVSVQVLASRGVKHWQRFSSDEDDLIEMVCGDPEWASLLEAEVELGEISKEARQIRGCIASLESCHEYYVGNIHRILEMIGPMAPSPVLDCGDACEEKRRQAASYAELLQFWLAPSTNAVEQDEADDEVSHILGEPDSEKVRLVKHLISKIRDNGYAVYAPEDEDFDLIESRIQHLDICNYNWLNNLRIVMHEIADDKRSRDWHVPDGFNAHGDLPDRTSELQPILTEATAWIEGTDNAYADTLGEPTPEKRWLVAWLCKNVSAQHAKLAGAGKLRVPTL